MDKTPQKAILPSPAAIRSLLARLGLEHKEIDVYMALLSLKVARVSSIAKAAGQSRSHTYLILRSLVQKGLVSELERGRILHFVAEPPQRLITFAENQQAALRETQNDLQHVLPFLQSREAPLLGEPRVTKLNGIQGMKQVYRDLLGNEFRGLFNPELAYNALDKSMFLEGIRGRDLLVNNDASRRYMRHMAGNPQYQGRLLPEFMKIETDTVVAGDTIALFTYDAEMTVICIQHQKVAETFRTIFDWLWELTGILKI